MKNVKFKYSSDKYVLDGFSMSVHRGQVAALVGPSGSGKSTVIKLLLGFYSSQSGSIYINGRSVGEYSLKELRDFMAYVSQDSYLFDATIEENIKYGKPDASIDEVYSAAKAANAHQFIMEQPEGYATMIGNQGIRLSGGQKQRIAIARALLKNAPILLLDEATSSLDSESEQLVQEALKRLMNGRTTLVVTHRLSSIENADMIFVIEDGRVSECGKHIELMQSDSLYKRLYDLQYMDNSEELKKVGLNI